MHAFTPKKIVILDDHPMIIDGIRLLLNDSAEFELSNHAKDVNELMRLPLLQTDILILDMNIKGENVLQHLPPIRSKFPQTKILIFSSYDSPSLVKKAFDRNVDGYLLKDTTQEELLAALRAISDGQKFIGEGVRLMKKKRKEMTDDFEKKIDLTGRELELVRLIATGMESKMIAEKLFISLHTVQSHRKNIMRKLDVHSAAEITRFALENKLI